MMLGNLFKELSQKLRRGSLNKKKIQLADEINKRLNSRQPQRVIELLRELLEVEPENVTALTELGVRLGDVGEIDEAYRVFELAHRLDDSNMHAAVNYASYLADTLKNSKEALPILARAQLLIPDYSPINAVYASVLLGQGKADIAREYRLRAWLADFDNARTGDGYLWYASYADIPARLLAAEHHFWAETYVPLPYVSPSSNSKPGPALDSRRLRIGYWSPDFKNHSVRYFFRPLLEGHDRSSVELILYHDASRSDAQTDEIKSHCDQFHSVSEKTDEELARLIVSHDLDVLVELAGHTSHNRLWMMQARLARLQITALGYPATTGLQSVDAKLVDPHVFSDNDGQYYSERPFVMPESFWCFDPREDVALPENPPVKANGFITFGCAGNVGKINKRMLTAWAEILKRVPRSRLILRSVNFIDPLSIEAMRVNVREAGIDEKRVDLVGPATGSEFFRSYDQLDIVLDTYPFNGGTTTSFAVYMGVPVVTMAGESLISRMGASVMTNAGGKKWIAVDEKEYVSKAVGLSQDIGELQDFRRNARARLKKTSLGNGDKFAGEFEKGCRSLLLNMNHAAMANKAPMPLLPAEEVTRRAAIVLSFGQHDAAKRIINYGLKNYPDFAGIHILLTDSLTEKGDFSGAADYLLEHLAKFDAEGEAAALINIIRFMIFSGNRVGAEENLHRLKNAKTDAIENAQADLYAASLAPPALPEPKTQQEVQPRKINCIVPCDDVNLYASIVEQLAEAAKHFPAGAVTFERCNEALRTASYEHALQQEDADVVVLMQKNIVILNPRIFKDILAALSQCDIVGFSGARKWEQIDWRIGPFENRSSGFINESSEKPGYFQVIVAGAGNKELTLGMQVLEGGFLAVNAKKAIKLPFDDELLDAGTLLEEYWSHTAAAAGLKLGVHRRLGVQLRSDITLSQTYLATSRLLLVERQGFKIFSESRTDGFNLVCPCIKAEDGFAIMENYFEK